MLIKIRKKGRRESGEELNHSSVQAKTSTDKTGFVAEVSHSGL